MIKGYFSSFLSRVIDLSKATWTMANQVAFRAMMADLGFGQPAADEVYTGQGVDSIIVQPVVKVDNKKLTLVLTSIRNDVCFPG